MEHYVDFKTIVARRENHFGFNEFSGKPNLFPFPFSFSVLS